MNTIRIILIAFAMLQWGNASAAEAATVQMCLTGAFDLGTRYQGLQPGPGEPDQAKWCVTTEDHTSRVHFAGSGKSNPDMDGQFALSYFHPDRVRIVNREAPPDIEFAHQDIINEARRQRRLDPLRLVQELRANPDWIEQTAPDGVMTVQYPGNPERAKVTLAQGRLVQLETAADMPLRGRAAVVWRWQWQDSDHEAGAGFSVTVAGDLLFHGAAQWRNLNTAEARSLWQPSGNQAARILTGRTWPAQVNMELEALADRVYFVRGVRTGFHHLVVDTEGGLVIGDAPAGWVELQQIPPADLVPGLGVSGLSEALLDFLEKALPGRPVRAVALTHFHDDHAGGARAFAAAGASVYAPAGAAQFLTAALNHQQLPGDRFSATGRSLEVIPVADRVLLDDSAQPVELINLGAGPHVSGVLGVWVPAAGYFFQSDLHVPAAETTTPRQDRLITECWFARWAAEHLPQHTLVLSSHGTIRSPVSRIRQYLTTGHC